MYRAFVGRQKIENMLTLLYKKINEVFSRYYLVLIHHHHHCLQHWSTHIGLLEWTSIIKSMPIPRGRRPHSQYASTSWLRLQSRFSMGTKLHSLTLHTHDITQKHNVVHMKNYLILSYLNTIASCNLHGFFHSLLISVLHVCIDVMIKIRLYVIMGSYILHLLYALISIICT